MVVCLLYDSNCIFRSNSGTHPSYPSAYAVLTNKSNYTIINLANSQSTLESVDLNTTPSF